MMAINRISRIKGVRIFRDFKWSSDLDDFMRFNLIYGWNGSGKSTLSWVLRHLETKTKFEEGTITINIDGTDLDGKDFPNFNKNIRVFNEEFVEENVFTFNNNLQPIYVIGKENIGKQSKIDELASDLLKLQEDLMTSQKNSATKSKAKDKFRIDKAKMIKDLLGERGNRYSSYNKSSFDTKAISIAELSNTDEKMLSDEDKEKYLIRIRTLQKPIIKLIEYDFPDISVLLNKSNSLLNTTVVSSAKEMLSNNSAISKWVSEGFHLHKESSSNSCYYCTQQLPQERVAELEAHFSKEYDELILKINVFANELQKLIESANKFDPPDEANLYDDFSSEYSSSVSQCQKEVNKVVSFLESLNREIAEKKTSPFNPMSVTINVPNICQDFLKSANEFIQKHNSDSEEFESRIKDSLLRLEESFVAEVSSEYAKIRQEDLDATKHSDSLDQQSKEVERQITALRQEIISHQEPATELNKDLRAYLGHNELKLSVKETGYQITRNGYLAKNLSEGERTAIALLYFLKSLKDNSFDQINGIVVLDDPVSSLDANALFNAFSFVKDRTEHIGQVIILTHNYTLYKAVRQWFKNLRGQLKKEWRIFMLEVGLKNNERHSEISEIDPLLKDYESEYHYLFSYIYKIAKEPKSNSLELYLPAPSIARRVLETFLSFRIPNNSSLYGRLSTVSFDEQKKTRIYRFVNTFAHRDSIGDSDDDLSILSETKSVMIDIIALMDAADKEHCELLIECVKKNP